MSKLPKEHKFTDLSDYGRPIARWIARGLKETKFTPIHVTWLFVLSALISFLFMLEEYFWVAGFFLLLKSVLDAADGELARIKETPSYTGRFFDSISDFVLNALLFIVITSITEVHVLFGIIAFLCMQLQGTLYNYYYTILRTQVEGDTTSRIFENEVPTAFPGEKQQHVERLYYLYRFLYGGFDKLIYYLDYNASRGPVLSNSFMTALSIFGLGFQLLLISILLIFGLKEFVMLTIIGMTTLLPFFIVLRRSRG